MRIHRNGDNSKLQNHSPVKNQWIWLRFTIRRRGQHILNASKSSTGPSWRMILDFSGDKIKGQGHYPGGQLAILEVIIT